jgi:hypothetical protein
VSGPDPDPAHAGPDVTAALEQVRVVFGPVQVLVVCAHAPGPDQVPQPALVQGRLDFDQETG